MYGRTGISEIRLIVVVCIDDGSSFRDSIAGDELADSLRSAEGLVESRDDEAFVSTSRGTSSVLEVLSRNMREPRSRGVPRVRE